MKKEIDKRYFEDYVDYIGDRNYYESLSEKMQKQYQSCILETIGYAMYTLKREVDNLKNALNNALIVVKKILVKVKETEEDEDKTYPDITPENMEEVLGEVFKKGELPEVKIH